jgi:ABC-type branched-subunit amino acid transport system ATPase component
VFQCRGVTVRFGGLVAVNNVDVTVPEQAIVGLVGPNGAGKSTLFGVLSGLLRPSSGHVFLDGVDITGTRPQLRAELGLARTFQHPEIFTGLTVRDHLVLSYRLRHCKRRVWSDLFMMGSVKRVSPSERAEGDRLLDLLGLSAVADLPARGLPLGTARLLELGRALATRPRVLLLDEPSSGLDPSETARFEATLGRVVSEQGLSVLLVEHDVELVMRLSRTIYVLDFGTLIASGAPADVRADRKVRVAYLGEEVPASNEEPASAAGSGPSLGGAGVRTALVPSGRRSDDEQGPSAAGLALTVDRLTVRYGDAIAVSDVSFSVPSGRVLAVLGSNGAGKSSVARALSGLVTPAAGSIRLFGEEIAGWPAHRVRRAGILHVPEGRGVFRSLSVIENLKMAVADVPGRTARRNGLEIAFAAFSVLASRRRQVAGSLSGGEQQMLSVARALATSPRFLIVDELSLGLAPRPVELVFEALAIARDAGISIIVIEQHVHRVLDFADTCLVLQRGSAAWQGSTDLAKGEVLRRYLGDAMTVGA